MAEKRGRPRLYDDPIFFEERVEAYFDECEQKEKPPTIAGISYFLGFCDKQSFSRYAEFEGFSITVKRARLRIEAFKNEMLMDRANATAGVIFDLKNNHGWSDKLETTDATPEEIGRQVKAAMRAMDEATVPEDDEDVDPEVV